MSNKIYYVKWPRLPATKTAQSLGPGRTIIVRFSMAKPDGLTWLRFPGVMRKAFTFYTNLHTDRRTISICFKMLVLRLTADGVV